MRLNKAVAAGALGRLGVLSADLDMIQAAVAVVVVCAVSGKTVNVGHCFLVLSFFLRSPHKRIFSRTCTVIPQNMCLFNVKKNSSYLY